MTLGKRHTHPEREAITGRKVDDGKVGIKVQVSVSRRRAGADRIRRADFGDRTRGQRRDQRLGPDDVHGPDYRQGPREPSRRLLLEAFW
jgi:hypothetical protein